MQCSFLANRATLCVVTAFSSNHAVTSSQHVPDYTANRSQVCTGWRHFGNSPSPAFPSANLLPQCGCFSGADAVDILMNVRADTRESTSSKQVDFGQQPQARMQLPDFVSRDGGRVYEFRFSRRTDLTQWQQFLSREN
jgi:hypothetical protein